MDLMSDPSNYPQFAEAAAQLLTEYGQAYETPFEIDHTHELSIRMLLNWEQQLKRRIPLDLRDYWIKTLLGIQQRDPKYEREILQLQKRKIH